MEKPDGSKRGHEDQLTRLRWWWFAVSTSVFTTNHGVVRVSPPRFPRSNHGTSDCQELYTRDQSV